MKKTECVQDAPSILKEVAALASVVALLTALFWRNFLPGSSISYLGLVTTFDRLYGADTYGQYLPFDADPSAPLLHIPNALFIERCASKFVFPLWNPFNGLGEPFAENIQSMVFSPLHFLFPASNLYWYNLGLVIAIIAGAIGAYVLGRMIGLSTWPSVLAALSYSLCPHILHNFELPGPLFPFPWVAASFIWLERSQRTNVSIAVGVLIATVLSFTHPETFFAAILGGILLGYTSALQRVGKGTALRVYLKNVSIAALVSILLSAPIIVPFVDLLKNSELYKTSSNPLHFYPWHEYIADLFLPYHDCTERSYLHNPYLGMLSAIVLPIGLLRTRTSLLAVSFLFFLLSTWMPPSDMVLSQPPLSYLLSNYFLPFLILMTALIGGFGMQSLVTSDRWNCLPRILTIASSIVVIGLNVANADLWREVINKSLTLDRSAVLTIIPIVSLLVISFIALGCLRKKEILWFCLVCFNVATLSLSVTRELPQVKQFDYPRNDVVSFLMKANTRFLATGDRLFIPNINLAYGLKDLRSLQVTHPKRYLKFLQAVGARTCFDYWKALPDQYDQLIDVASVNYLATLGCITSRDEADDRQGPVCKSQTGRVAPGIRLTDCTVSYDGDRAQVKVNATWKVQAGFRDRYQIQYQITNDHGDDVRRSNWLVFEPLQTPGANIENHQIALPVPISLQGPFSVTASCNRWGYKILKPDGSTLACIGKNLILGSFQATQYKAADNRSHFKIVFENEAGVRIYENQRAVPEAYLAFSGLAAASEDDALNIICKASFNPQVDVVIESDSGVFTNTDNQRKLPIQPVSVEWVSPNEVQMQVEPGHKSILVFSQFFYPGWKAWVDGQSVPVFHANYIFQSVVLEPGKHAVRFEYQPEVFFYSCVVAGVTALFLLLLAVARLRSVLVSARHS